MMQRSAAWADRVMARLPSTADVAWWTHRLGLGLLRLDCLLVTADALIDQSAGREAGELLDAAAAEVERHLADHRQWLTESRHRIARRRARLPQ